MNEETKRQPQQNKRVQFEFSEEAVDRLDELVQTMDASSRAEVVRRALALMDYVVQARNNGAKLVLRASDGSESGILVL